VKLLDTSMSFTAQAVKLFPPTAAASGVSATCSTNLEPNKQEQQVLVAAGTT
jgi:hypothetical protein